MDKIRQAIERARSEKDVAATSSRTESTATMATLATKRAAMPFEPNLETMGRAHLLPATDPGAAGNAIRLLRTIVLQKMRERGWRTLGIVASHGADGKSVLAGNLAIAIATDPRSSAVLVELDVEAPWLASAFDAPPTPGLAAALVEEADVDDCVLAPTGFGRLEIIPLASNGNLAESGILALPRLASLLKSLSDRPDTIAVVDLPAVLDNDGALTASTLCDCLLYAVREGVTKRADLERGLGLLAAVPVLGTVLLDSLTAPMAESSRG